MTFLLAYWRQAVIGALCIGAVAWCAQRDERIRSEGEARILRAQIATLESDYSTLADSLERVSAEVRVQVDTARVIITQTVRDTVEVERIVDELRDVVPDSVFQKVERLEELHREATDALTLAYATIGALEQENDLLRQANANLTQQIEALNAAQPDRKGWLDAAMKVGAGIGVGYVLASK